MPQIEIYKKPKKMTFMNITIIIIFSLIILLAALLWFAGDYFYDYSIKTKPYEERIANKDNIPKIENGNGITLEITSRDGLKLVAYEFDNDLANSRWAIVVHGYKSSAKYMEKYINNFYKLGYNVLALDLRGHGASEGDYIGMGFIDRLDVLDWVQEIINKDKNAEITLYGLSMGAATVMMVSGEEDVPLNIKCIIEDCGYTSAYDEFSYKMKQEFGLPKFPFLNAADMMTKIRADYTFEEASAFKAVGISKTPILFIHGDKDDYVPYDNLQKLYDNASCEKEMLSVIGAGHAESEEVAGDEYWNRIKLFIDKYMGKTI